MRSFCNSSKKEITLTGILIDMDDFKPINDNFGHHIGDKALMVFAEVLRKHINKFGFVVRYGGDEFILITKKSEKTAEMVVSEIKNEIKDINESGKYQFKLAFSYGMTTVNSESTSDEFLNAMDSRMYEMKKKRKSR